MSYTKKEFIDGFVDGDCRGRLLSSPQYARGFLQRVIFAR
jgi:hypothetical protein